MNSRRTVVCVALLLCSLTTSAFGSAFSASFAEYAPGEAVNDARWPRALLEREGRLNCVVFVAYDQNGAMVARNYCLFRTAPDSDGASYLHSCRIALPIPHIGGWRHLCRTGEFGIITAFSQWDGVGRVVDAGVSSRSGGAGTRHPLIRKVPVPPADKWYNVPAIGEHIVIEGREGQTRLVE